MVSDLELVSTEELIDELVDRHDDLIVIRKRDYGPDDEKYNVHINIKDDENEQTTNSQYPRCIKLCTHGINVLIDGWVSEQKQTEQENDDG